MLDKEKETYQYFSLHVCLSDVPVEVDGNSYVFLTGGGCVGAGGLGGTVKRSVGLVSFRSFVLSFLPCFFASLDYLPVYDIVDNYSIFDTLGIVFFSSRGPRGVVNGEVNLRLGVLIPPVSDDTENQSLL